MEISLDGSGERSERERIGHAAVVRRDDDAVPCIDRGLQSFDATIFDRVNSVRLAHVALQILVHHPGPKLTVDGRYEFVGLVDYNLLHGTTCCMADE